MPRHRAGAEILVLDYQHRVVVETRQRGDDTLVSIQSGVGQTVEEFFALEQKLGHQVAAR